MLVTFHTAAHIISFHFRYLLVAISHPRDGDSIRITWIELQEQQSPLSQFHLLTNTLSHYCPHLIHSNMNFMLLCLFITRLYKTYANMYYKYPAHVLPEEIWMNQGKTKYIFANQTLWTACRNAINRIIVVHIIWCDFNLCARDEYWMGVCVCAVYRHTYTHQPSSTIGVAISWRNRRTHARSLARTHTQSIQTVTFMQENILFSV